MADAVDVLGVVGAGIMGRGIALAFALSGTQVRLADADLAAAVASRERLRPDLEIAIAVGVTDADPDEVLARIKPVGSITKAADGAGLVIEAVPENLELKVRVWQELADCAHAETILASNTSSFDLDLIAASVPHAGRVIGSHWFNPAHIVTCVEVVRGSQTREETVDEICDLLRAIGKRPNVVQNSPGFIANRIQFAMVREAIACLDEGLASAQVIDEIVQTSFGPRLSAFGPLQLADLGGLDTYQSILRYLADQLGNRYDSPPLLDRLVAQHRLGVKTLAGISDYDEDSARALLGRRDEALYRLFGQPAQEASYP